MKQKISELMDGELQQAEAMQLLDSLKKDDEMGQEWAIYHLIGDVMRQPELARNTIDYTVRERLKTEPAILSPVKNTKKPAWQAWSVSIAATVSAVGVVAWMSMQMGAGQTPKGFAELRTQKPAITADSNDYVMAHQEFSSGPDMNGGAYYVRTVAYAADGR